MGYVIGIDQGGSKTHAMLADGNGHLLALSKSYGACHSVQGMEKAMAAIDATVNDVLNQANLTIADISYMVAGLTGVDWPYESELLKDTISAHFSFAKEKLTVVNDCIIAMRAGTQKETCGILCAGSGLNCALRKNKQTEFVFGFYISDEYQGGAALGRKAIQAVLDSEVGLQDKTVLTEYLLEHFKLNNVDELLYKSVTKQIAGKEQLQLPILLEEAAKNNDKVALEILSQYGKDIAKYVVAGMKKLNMLDLEADIILSGSIFKCKVPVMQQNVINEILRHTTKTTIVNSYYEPIVGAVLLALDQFYEVIPQDVYDIIKCDTSRFDIVRK